MQRASQIVFFVYAWRHDLGLCALRHPRCPDRRQEMNIEFSRKDYHLMRWHIVVMKPTAGQPLDPVWVVSLGTSSARFHAQPISWSQRRTISVERMSWRGWTGEASTAPIAVHKRRRPPPSRQRGASSPPVPRRLVAPPLHSYGAGGRQAGCGTPPSSMAGPVAPSSGALRPSQRAAVTG
jgi:hypothetical protein